MGLDIINVGLGKICIKASIKHHVVEVLATKLKLSSNVLICLHLLKKPFFRCTCLVHLILPLLVVLHC
jgi:hypothetical protein